MSIGNAIMPLNKMMLYAYNALYERCNTLCCAFVWNEKDYYMMHVNAPRMFVIYPDLQLSNTEPGQHKTNYTD